MTREHAVKFIRRSIGITQSQLAAAIGVSPKAVQSYEQGWRKTPDRVIKQMLSIAALKEHDRSNGTPCWDIRACDARTITACPAFQVTHGRHCWSVASKECARGRQDPDLSVVGCLDCPVVTRFLRP